MIVAGTGHRPKYMPCKYNEHDKWAINIKHKIEKTLYKLNTKTVISGMALGFDMWLAEAALNLNLKLLCYIPFPNQGDAWPTNSKKRYQSIINQCNEVVITSDKYHKGCFFIRDKAMVDNADLILALKDPNINSGGTAYTINYATFNNKKVINLWE